MDSQSRIWCYFSNVVHAVYREIRHIGPVSDNNAKLLIVVEPYIGQAELCMRNRKTLKGTVLHEKVQDMRTVDAIIETYEKMTGLTLEDLVEIYGKDGWRPNYGGKKWAKIAKTAVDFAKVLRNNDEGKSIECCERIKELSHNSGRLIPERTDWLNNKYLQEKWPVLCD